MKVTAILLQSVDGIISRYNGDDLSWDIKEDKVFYREKTREMDCLIMGRSTFQTVNPKAIKDKFVVVLTSKPEEFKEQENLMFTKESPENILKYLKGMGKENIAIVGGGKVYGEFSKLNLIDEIYISLAPKLFGTKGTKDFSTDELDTNLKLLEVKNLSDDFLLLHYRVIKPGTEEYASIQAREQNRKEVKAKYSLSS